MKQLYATLEDKEKELRDFIRNYEQVRKRKKSQQKMDNNRIIIVSNKKNISIIKEEIGCIYKVAYKQTPVQTHLARPSELTMREEAE